MKPRNRSSVRIRLGVLGTMASTWPGRRPDDIRSEDTYNSRSRNTVTAKIYNLHRQRAVDALSDFQQLPSGGLKVNGIRVDVAMQPSWPLQHMPERNGWVEIEIDIEYVIQ